MKNIYCILITILFGMQVQAQSFPMPGAEMWYNHHYFGGPNYQYGYTHAQINGDTIINGLSYSIFQGNRIVKDVSYQNDTSFLNIPLNKIFFAVSNDTVYQWLNNEKTFLWHNNPNNGDIWCYGTIPMPAGGTQMLCAKAYVETENINGIASKKINLFIVDTLGNFNCPDFGMSYLGTVNNLMGPSIDIFDFYNKLMYRFTICHYELYGDESMKYNLLSCWQADNMPLVHLDSNQHCKGSLFFTNEVYTPISGLKIFPNPVANVIHIANDGDSDATGQIIDLQGRVVRSHMKIKAKSESVFSLVELPDGMYILKCSDENGNVQTHKIIKN